jgi:hypothetical protein
MGCPSKVLLGDNLTFGICCHDPNTGVLTDTDGVPAYRIYEDETATAILADSMAKLDNANTTGFYAETIACTTANGFEDRKNYTIYIAATVDGDTGGIPYTFNVDPFGPGLYNWKARTKAFNFNAKTKAFNFNAKTKAFNFTANIGA